jgi:hypothetical protein
MKPKCKNNVHCNTQHGAMCFAPWPQIALKLLSEFSMFWYAKWLD